MKKGVWKKFNIPNKISSTIIVVLAIMLFGASVYAYGTTAPATFGHSIGELDPPSGCLAGRFLSWGSSSWICTQPSVSDIPDSSRFVQNVEIVSESDTYNGCYGGQTIQCPANTKVIGGGCSTGSGNSLEKSYPLYYPEIEGWYCQTANTPDIECNIYAICAQFD